MARFALCSLAVLLALPTWAQASDYFCPDALYKADAPAPSHRGEVTLSAFTHHWSRNPEHKTVVLASAHEMLPGDRLCGLALFTNSFGQPSTYVYAGQQYRGIWGVPELSFTVTAGVLYGYVGKYQNKVPLNSHGFSPAIIPALSYHFNAKDAVQLNMLGSAALMLAYTRRF